MLDKCIQALKLLSQFQDSETSAETENQEATLEEVQNNEANQVSIVLLIIKDGNILLIIISLCFACRSMSEKIHLNT